jgi:hypothetical protein
VMIPSAALTKCSFTRVSFSSTGRCPTLVSSRRKTKRVLIRSHKLRKRWA